MSEYHKYYVLLLDTIKLDNILTGISKKYLAYCVRNVDLQHLC